MEVPQEKHSIKLMENGGVPIFGNLMQSIHES